MRTATALVFLLLAAFGVFVHARDATSRLTNQWSIFPVSVDEVTGRLWDWYGLRLLRACRAR
jgi:hypothetical protein